MYFPDIRLDRYTVDVRVTARDGVVTRQHAERSRLASPVDAEQPETFAVTNR